MVSIVNNLPWYDQSILYSFFHWISSSHVGAMLTHEEAYWWSSSLFEWQQKAFDKKTEEKLQTCPFLQFYSDECPTHQCLFYLLTLYSEILIQIHLVKMQAYIFEQYTIIVWRLSVLSSTDLNEEIKKIFQK